VSRLEYRRIALFDTPLSSLLLLPISFSNLEMDGSFPHFHQQNPSITDTKDSMSASSACTPHERCFHVAVVASLHTLRYHSSRPILTIDSDRSSCHRRCQYLSETPHHHTPHSIGASKVVSAKSTQLRGGRLEYLWPMRCAWRRQR
jgi:hypothetical protein